MLNDALLLDSTRPVSTTNIHRGCPEHSSQGVLSSWHVLRVTYSRELKIKAILEQKGVQAFVPMMWKTKITDGVQEKKLVPAVSNLCFVYWDKDSIDTFISGFGDNSPVHYYWDRTTNRPMTVNAKAMADFIAVASTMDEDLIYITEINDKLREGQTVRVKNGPFAGVQGKIVRIRKSRRILVELPGMLAVATTYVSPEDVEQVN